jgi:hypothetical protein
MENTTARESLEATRRDLIIAALALLTLFVAWTLDAQFAQPASGFGGQASSTQLPQCGPTDSSTSS